MSTIDAIELKKYVKEAFNEAFLSNKELIYNIIFEAFEDVKLLDAIKEGENSGLATREEIFSILEGN